MALRFGAMLITFFDLKYGHIPRLLNLIQTPFTPKNSHLSNVFAVLSFFHLRLLYLYNILQPAKQLHP